MADVSIFPQAKFGQNDHRADAHHLISEQYLHTDKGDNELSQPSYRHKAPAEAIEGPPVTFKDLVERRAAQRNHIFMPKGKQFLGKVFFQMTQMIYCQYIASNISIFILTTVAIY